MKLKVDFSKESPKPSLSVTSAQIVQTCYEGPDKALKRAPNAKYIYSKRIKKNHIVIFIQFIMEVTSYDKGR